MIKRLLCCLLAVCLVLTMAPAMAWADVEGGGEPTGCTHVHDASCGYIKEITAVPCSNNGVIACTHQSCGYVEAAEGVACDSADPETCTHESCSYKEAVTGIPCGNPEGFPCDHTECGYVEAVAGSPCTHEHSAECVPDGKLDIAAASVVIEADGYTLGTNDKVTYAGDYVISQTDAATATANTITVNGIADGKTVTLNGVNILSVTKNIVPIKANASVTLQLSGENYIKYTAAQDSALHIAKDATVTLCVPAGEDDSYGSLTADVTGRYTSAIGASDRAVAGYLVINSGTVTAKRTGSTSEEGTSIGAVRPNGIHIMQGITVNGGILNATSVNGKPMGTDSKADNIAPITINGGYVYSNTGYSSNITVNGGNVKADAGKEPTVTGKTMTRLYVVNDSGTALKDEKIDITVGSNTWSTYTDNEGIVTTYLADADTVTCGERTCTKLPDGWLIGGNCVCDTADLTFTDMANEVDVYSADLVVDVTVRGECTMPIHKSTDVIVQIDSVTLEGSSTAVEDASESDYAVYADGKLTMKPAGNTDNYTVTLSAKRIASDTPVTYNIKVWASNTVGRKLDVSKGDITVASGTGENEGKVVYTQGEDTFAVTATDIVTITGTSQTNNIEISTSAAIELSDLNLTDIKAKSPIKITGNSEVTLWLKGENQLISGVYDHNDEKDNLRGTTTAAIFVESGSTLIIDSETGDLKNSDIDAEHYGDKQQGYAGSLLAKNTGSRGGASAIGGDYFSDPNMACGNIIIKGGNITAQAALASNKHASGSAIGSGYAAGDGSEVAIAQCGDITIAGGNIRALASEGSTTPGRAISSGVGDLTITGGVIYASAPNDGWNGDSAGSIATFTGILTIGEENGDDSDLYIYAATTTTDVGQGDVAAPAISVNSGGILNILSGTITAESTGNGPAIGIAPYALEAEEPVELNIKGGAIDLVLADETQAGTTAAIGIGGNNNNTAVEINISGGTIESNNLNIGGRISQDSTVNISGDAEVNINNGNLVGNLNVSDEAAIAIDGNINGNVTAEGGTSVNGSKLPENLEGTLTIPGGSIGDIAVDSAKGTVTLPAGTIITDAEGGTQTIPDTVQSVTVKADKVDEVKVNDNGSVSLPSGSKVTDTTGKETVMNYGGTISAEGKPNATIPYYPTVTPSKPAEPDQPADPYTPDTGDTETDAEKTERIINGVENTTLKAKSTKTSKGIKITWTKSKGYKVDYYEVHRSTKKSKGYGTKPIYTTKNEDNSGTKTFYINTKNLKKGTRYYYRVRGVRVIDGVKYYTEASKAWRTF